MTLASPKVPTPFWVQRLHKYDIELNQSGQALELIERTLDQIPSAQWSEDILHIDLKQISITAMVGVLRLSYFKRQAIPNWGEFLSRVENILPSRGAKDTVLRGLRSNSW